VPLDTPPATLLGMPKEYAFLLIGLIAGGLIGWWIGRAWGLASAAARSMAGRADAAAEAGLPPGVSLVVNGRNIDVSAEAMAEIQSLLRTGKTVEAIKVLREASGLGLEEAKAVLGSLEKVMH
jgi:ribosomal protein L7/L12